MIIMNHITKAKNGPPPYTLDMSVPSVSGPKSFADTREYF